MENVNFCQSCGMPLQNPEEISTEKDGSKSSDYCVYCYKDGTFTADISMEEMIAFCAENAGSWGMEISKEEAITQMNTFFPTLRRWAKQ